MTATTAPPTVTATFCHTFRPWWIGVKCEWHNPHAYVGSGCMVCGPLVERVQRLARSPEWRRWKTVLLADGDANEVVGDWLEENGWPELADEARRTWTHIAVCPSCKGRGKYKGGRQRLHPYTCHRCNATGKVLTVEVVPVDQGKQW